MTVVGSEYDRSQYLTQFALFRKLDPAKLLDDDRYSIHIVDSDFEGNRNLFEGDVLVVEYGADPAGFKTGVFEVDPETLTIGRIGEGPPGSSLVGCVHALVHRRPEKL